MSTPTTPLEDPLAPPPLLPQTGTINVLDCDIRWYAGGTGGPTIVLVHGGGAHSGWWEPILPTLTARQRVIAVDMSGHGDSGRRPGGYPATAWTAEVAGVISQVAGEPVALVAHSLGGRIGTLVAANHPQLVTTLVLLDSVIPAYDKEPIARVRAPRIYGSRDEILASFKLMPPQPPVDPSVMHRLGERSIRPLPDGTWTWKFDPTIFGNMDDRFEATPQISNVICPVTMVLGGLSDVTPPGMADRFERLLGRPMKLVTFPDSRHHTPLDAPDELLALLLEVAGPA